MERTALDLLTVVVSPVAGRLRSELIQHHGSQEAANAWLAKPNDHLNGMTPQTFLEIGLRNQTDKSVVVVSLVHYHETGQWEAYQEMIEGVRERFPDLVQYLRLIPQAT